MATQLKPVPGGTPVWQGRTDTGERGDTRRLFNMVREIDPHTDATPPQCLAADTKSHGAPGKDCAHTSIPKATARVYSS